MRDYRALTEATRGQVWDRREEGLGLSEISRTLEGDSCRSPGSKTSLSCMRCEEVGDLVLHVGWSSP
jgi:hypothetical protein